VKIFAVAHTFNESFPKFTATSGKVGVTYVAAETEEEAREKFGYSGVFAVKEITIDEFLKTGASS